MPGNTNFGREKQLLAVFFLVFDDRTPDIKPYFKLFGSCDPPPPLAENKSSWFATLPKDY